jgi:hypothetical protein
MEVPLAQDNKTQAVSDLLGGIAPADPGTEPEPTETPPSSGDAAPIAPAEPEGTPDLTPAVLAEKLGIKPSELFSMLKIPVDGGDAMTLEEFKDAGKELRAVRQTQDELAEAKVAHENSVMTQRQQLTAAIGKIPPELLTTDMVLEVQADQAKYVQTERAALIGIRPDLNEPGKWSATRDLLIAHLKPYGFHAIEIDRIIDHRLAKYVIDNAERGQRLAKLEQDGLTPVVKPKAARPTRAPRKPAKIEADNATVQRGKRATTNRDKAREVAKLLG